MLLQPDNKNTINSLRTHLSKDSLWNARLLLIHEHLRCLFHSLLCTAVCTEKEKRGCAIQGLHAAFGH